MNLRRTHYDKRYNMDYNINTNERSHRKENLKNQVLSSTTKIGTVYLSIYTLFTLSELHIKRPKMGRRGDWRFL